MWVNSQRHSQNEILHPVWSVNTRVNSDLITAKFYYVGNRG